MSNAINRCAHEVQGALEQARRARYARRRRAEQRKSLDPVDRGAWTDGLEQPRNDVDLHVVIAQGTDELEHLLVSIL